MATTPQLFIKLAIVLAIWYLVSTLPRAWIGTCVDGECGFSAREIIVSIALPLLAVTFTVTMEMRLFRRNLGQALDNLGLTRLNIGSLRLAGLILLPLLAFYPLYSLLADVPVGLVPNWPWLLLGAFLYNGLNEETIFRGLIFRHLRAGRTFWRAATLSVLYFAGAHVPLIFSSNLPVGLVSILYAIPTGYLLAYLYERGRNTVWGCVLFHAVNNGVPFIALVSPTGQLIASLLYLLVGFITTGGFMVWVFRSRQLSQEARNALV
ncbi:MAG TPA: CPBP family intramembrane glutamic endopeptidase [Anaerolineae bacterium]|nr:CPBP family intramembrane glutamic endopeptidase [Anaerolineae bacterium]